MNRINLENIEEKEIGYLIGFFVGDGYRYYSKKDRHYMVEFCFNSLTDNKVAEIIGIILNQMGMKYFIKKDKRFNHFKIRVNSKKLMEFVENKLIEFEKSHFPSKDYKLGLISGFIDADGYVKHGELLLTQKNKETIMKFIKICESLGIPSRKIWSKRNYKSKSLVWRARISTKFKHLNHNSYKVRLAYSGVEHGL